MKANRSLLHMCGALLALLFILTCPLKAEAQSPEPNRIYEPGEAIEVKWPAPDLVDIYWNGSYVLAHSMALEIYKDGVRLYREDINYYPSDEGDEMSFKDFTPTKEGTYTIRYGAVAFGDVDDPLSEEYDAFSFTVASPAVEKIEFLSPPDKIAKGKSVRLQTVITPASLENTALKWKSSNTKVVTVSSAGVVKGIKTGTATITVTVQDSGKQTASFKVTVVNGAVKKITLTPKAPGTCFAGDTLRMKAEISADQGASKKILWTSSNPEYAAVDQSGKVKINDAGRGKSVRITAEATDGSGVKKTVKIKISPLSWQIRAGLTAKGKISLKKGSKNAAGKTFKLRKDEGAQIAAEKTSGIKSVSYKSSDSKIVSVSKKGALKAKKPGTAVITINIKKKNKKTVSAKIKVKVDNPFPYQDSAGRTRYQMVINGKTVPTDTPPFFYPESKNDPYGYFPLADVLKYAGIKYSTADGGKTITGTLYGKTFRASANDPDKMTVNDEVFETEKNMGRPVMVDGVLFVPKYFFAMMTDDTYCEKSSDGKSLCIVAMPIVK